MRAQWLFPFVFAVGAELSSQTVWVVDDTASTGPDFTDLQTAIDTVPDGDVLLLKTGTYPRMEIVGKSLTIVADRGHSPVIRPAGSLANRARVASLGPNQSVRLQGLEILEQGPDPALLLADSFGTIWVENCTLTSQIEGGGMRVSNCGSVALLRVTATGGAALQFAPGTYSPTNRGLDVLLDSDVHSYAGLFIGGKGPSYVYDCDLGIAWSGGRGSAGVRSDSPGNFVFLSGRSCRGGDGQSGAYCDHACNPGPGGPGLENLGGSVYVLDALLAGGLPECGGGVGPSFSGASPVFLPGRALLCTAASPVREGGSLHLDLAGPPFVPVWVATASAPGTQPGIDLVRGTALLSLAGTLDRRFLGVTDATGQLGFDFTAGTLPVGVDSAPIFAQFFYQETPTLPGGHLVLRYPRIPAAFVLGQAVMITTLDSSL